MFLGPPCPRHLLALSSRLGGRWEKCPEHTPPTPRHTSDAYGPAAQWPALQWTH